VNYSHFSFLISKQSYQQQPSLLGRLQLADEEKLIATFRFEPQEWQKAFLSANKFPGGIGSVDGIGHITSRRLVLFWDTEGALKREVAEEVVDYAGAYFSLSLQALMAAVDINKSLQESKSRKPAKKSSVGSSVSSPPWLLVLAGYFPPNGIGIWHFPLDICPEEELANGEDVDNSCDEIFFARMRSGVFSPVIEVGPFLPMTFHPDFFDYGMAGQLTMGWNLIGFCALRLAS
jgi:hypothetical protein